jgi:hypothetical protein
MTDALRFTTFEDVLSVFATTQGADRAAKFAEGDALILASAPDPLAALGFTRPAQLYRAVAEAMSMSKRTLLYRVATAQAFVTEDARSVPVAWDIYRVASGMNNPAYWLNRAYEDHLSADKLRTVYKAAEGREPDEIRVVWPLRNAEARMVAANPQARRVTFEFAEGVDLGALSGEWGQMSLSVASVQEVAREAA